MNATMEINIIPSGWREVTCPVPGARAFAVGQLRVLVDKREKKDGKLWIHVSVSHRQRLPSWEELVEIKEILMGCDAKAIQVIPPRSEHVNIHPNCLHLFSCPDGDGLPDFRDGGML